MRRLFRPRPAAEADVRPSLLGVVTLLFLLLFFLLATSSGQRLGAIALRFSAAGELAPLPHAGVLRSVRVDVAPAKLELQAEVATTDIAASATSSEVRRWSFPDVGGLDATLAELHALDRSQRRATVRPSPDVTTDQLLLVLDAVRGPGATRFPEVALEGRP